VMNPNIITSGITNNCESTSKTISLCKNQTQWHCIDVILWSTMFIASAQRWSRDGNKFSDAKSERHWI